MKCKWIMAALTLLLAMPAMAQMPGPGGPPMSGPHPRHLEMGEWWKNSEVVQQIHLSDAQRKQIEQNYLEFRLRLIDANAEVQKQETKLGALMAADQFNESQAVAQLDQLLAARTRLGKDYAMMLITVRRVLTPEQWKTLESLRRERRGPRSGMGPGGPGGPGRRNGPGQHPGPAPAAPPPGQEE